MKKLSKLLLFIALVSFSIQLNATQSDSITHKKYWGVYEMPTEKRTVTVLDSIVEFNAEGERRYNEEYVYDKNGIMILRTEYTWSENKQFPETSKKVYEYDINANLLKEVWYRWNIDTNDWICRTKWEYAYDKYNNKIFQKEFIYRTAKEQWEGYTYAYEYAYDERGNLLLEIKYFYDPGTSEMDSIFKKTYKYDNFDNKIEEVY
ncbi:hypothetical protein LJC06_00350, partial [Bacteroidales bacterium OttesenSCG-928-I14]|nr:hypothetical protein [Bacteroidales bacterium OttesenSCG-928-I14]